MEMEMESSYGKSRLHLCLPANPLTSGLVLVRKELCLRTPVQKVSMPGVSSGQLNSKFAYYVDAT